MTRRRLPLLAPSVLASIVLASALLAGCSDSAGPTGTVRTAGPTATPTATRNGNANANARASAGCGTTTATTGRRTFGGRAYLLTLPKDHGRTPVPLVLDLHGLRSTGFQQAVYGRMATVGSARGFAVVEPESARGRTGWKLPGMSDGQADIRYVSALIGHLERTLCVNEKRVYAAGFSNGAGLSAALVCGLNGRLAAIAPVAGLNLARPCRGARPTTIIAFHGTADTVIPYGGGEPFGGDRTQVPRWMRPLDGVWALPPIAALAGQWARAFGCTSTGRDTPAREISHVAYASCKNGARVELYTIIGGGHTWPGALPLGVGRTTDQINATNLILDAFAKP